MSRTLSGSACCQQLFFRIELDRSPRPPQRFCMVSQSISHYKVLSEVGRGGMGVVYKAEDTKLKRFVALKFLRSDVLEDEEHRERFLREAQAAAALDHSNICTVYEIDEAGGETFIAMAFIEGRTVKDKIAERPLKLEEALDIAIQTAQGLQAAHEKGIVHRDIKSANLMVTAQGQVKVMDFGLAQLAERSQLTKTATMLGTPAYMSPEQAQRLPTDRRTDIWSLGVVIYEMVTGRLPFEGERQQAVLYAIANEEAEPITALRVGVPTELDRLVGKAMSKDAGERYQHVDEMLVDLRTLLKERESGASRAVPLARRGFRQTAWRAGAALAAVVLVAAVVWLGSLRQPVESPEPPLRVTPLTTYPGYELAPSFSPSGDQVAFVWDGDNQDNFDIYVKLVGEGTPLRLTDDPAADGSPAWSPDGRQIAFLRFGSQPEGAADVMLVPPIGGPERTLARIDSLRIDQQRWRNLGLAWSPDGKQLALVGRDSPREPYGIFLLSVETGEKRRLAQPRVSTGRDFSPDFSPDGQKVAFVRETAAVVADIYVVRVTGGQPERVTDLGAPIHGLAWTSDGREIIFSASLQAGGALYRIPASGGNPRQVAAAGEAYGKPALAPQARRLAYARVVSDYNIWRIDLASAGVRKPMRPLIASTRNDVSGRFSPDGKRIVFASNRSGTMEIWVCDADGSNALQLTSFNGPNTGTPRWSPDARSIVFDSRPGGNADIFVVGASGGAPRRITTDPSEDVVPSWSRDGRWIYFASNRSGELQVWKVPVEGEEPEGAAAVQVTRQGGFVAFESPDGKWVYYAKRRGRPNAIWRVPAVGGEEAPVVQGLSSNRPSWTVVEEGVYFVDRDPASFPGEGWGVKFLNLQDGRVSLITELPNRPSLGSGGLDVSPNGAWLIISQQGQSGSDLMLAENFR